MLKRLAGLLLLLLTLVSSVFGWTRSADREPRFEFLGNQAPTGFSERVAGDRTSFVVPEAFEMVVQKARLELLSTGWKEVKLHNSTTSTFLKENTHVSIVPGKLLPTSHSFEASDSGALWTDRDGEGAHYVSIVIDRTADSLLAKVKNAVLRS